MIEMPIPPRIPGPTPETTDFWRLVRERIEREQDEYICFAARTVLGWLETMDEAEVCDWVVTHLGGNYSYESWVTTQLGEFMRGEFDARRDALRAGRLAWLDQIIEGCAA